MRNHKELPGNLTISVQQECEGMWRGAGRRCRGSGPRAPRRTKAAGRSPRAGVQVAGSRGVPGGGREAPSLRVSMARTTLDRPPPPPSASPPRPRSRPTHCALPPPLAHLTQAVPWFRWRPTRVTGDASLPARKPS